jgi:hypothetical protein
VRVWAKEGWHGMWHVWQVWHVWHVACVIVAVRLRGETRRGGGSAAEAGLEIAAILCQFPGCHPSHPTIPALARSPGNKARQNRMGEQRLGR